MSNYNKVKSEGMEVKFLIEDIDCLVENDGYFNKLPMEKLLQEYLSTFADKVKEAVEEENAQSLKDILNRCKTERGLGVAIANFIINQEK